MAYPSLFELEEIAAAIAKFIGFGEVFPCLRYRFLLDLVGSDKFGYTVQILPDEMVDAAAYVDRPNKCVFIRASIHSLGLKGAAHPLMVILH